MKPIEHRDPARIDRILNTIRTIWVANPDMRLCQLIGNCFGEGDLYYTDDLDLEQALTNSYETNINKSP
jgi:hypothetical protein